MEDSPAGLGRTRAAAAAASSSARRPHPTVTPSPAAAATPTGATSDKYRRQQPPAQEDVSPVAKVNERASHVGAATLFIGPPAAADVSAADDAAAACGRG